MTGNQDRVHPKSVGCALMTRRHAAGLSQRELADRVNAGVPWQRGDDRPGGVWTSQTVSRLELGRNGQSLRLLAMYMDALGLPLRELF